MKTARQWIKDLPEAIQDEIYKNELGSNADSRADSPAKAIDFMFGWSYTVQGDSFWRGLCQALPKSEQRIPGPKSAVRERNESAFEKGFALGQSCYGTDQSSPASAEAPQPQHKQQNTTHMDTSKYSDQPVANVTLVFGTDASTLGASSCLAAIKSNNAQIKDLTETGIGGAYIEKQVAGLQAANEVLIARLNSLA